ncbi:hypothetical protein B0J13DRAFT_478097 [Dactylonectria estremocensis]|uniref:Carrier domain-containing protein n=1 Tax=Dactylonectria estremocensis TaxID=1079267 RepID=A0A9P9EML3_9HYPO|nr:hypothetical protein B0J13DRAFT_478097 [Dactylonectria estremocensis]
MLASVTTPILGQAPCLDAAEPPEAVTVMEPDKINSINEFLVFQAQSIPDTPLIAYPSSKLGASDFVDYTAKQLDDFADSAAKTLASQGLKPTKLRSNKADVVGILGPSNLDYIVNLLALSRMGFSVLFLSTRLPTEAYISLLEKTECTRILAAPKLETVVESIQESYPVQSFPMTSQSVWSHNASTRFKRQTELVDEENTVSFIVHSSGSTGLPKPIYQTHRQCLSNYATGSGMRAFVTLPLFHNHGLSTMFRGMVTGKRTAIYNANLPLTNGHLVAAMKAADFESFHCVPYALKVLAETPEGIAALAKAKLVLFGGSSCPDDLGDLLVKNDVNIVSHYGATEMGQLMTSQRDPATDKSWNYVRPLPKTKPYLLFDEITTGIYEAVVLDGLTTKTTSNSDDPPNSFRTRDTFVKHPTLEDAWKYLGRLDDRVTLFNGEKVLPVPYEHRVRQSEFVQECLVFGVGRAFPGLLIVPSSQAADKTSSELLDLLWPTIQDANEKAEQFGRISREMVEVLPAGTEYPRTDKGTVIRAACYQHFETLIEDKYQKFENPDTTDRLALELPELKEYLMKLLTERVGVAHLSDEMDFFDAGLDSLQAITARAHIVRELDLGGNVPGQNVVFEHPSVVQLAAYVDSLRKGSTVQEKTETEIMQDLVAKYSSFEPFKRGTQVPDGEVVLLTGATGSLGAHILSQLLALPRVSHVYCLVRASSPSAAQERVLDSLKSRGLTPHHSDAHKRIISSLTERGLSSYHHSAKFTALPADLSLPDLGLGDDAYDALRSSLTSVIHSAWAVNFTLTVKSFESQHIAGLRHLLDLCLSVPFSRPARLSFISSISAAAGTPSPARVPETLVKDPAHAQNMGYARSKWVAEHIVNAAAVATGMEARVLRSGQIVGDSTMGLWNPTEAIPLMFRAAVTLGALPALDETPSWLPVDKSARSVLELSGLAASGDQTAGYFQLQDSPGVVYHLQNPQTSRWTEDILPAMATAGLQFEIVKQRDWVQRLRDGEQDPTLNPTVKLLDFFAEKYDNDNPGRAGLVFETTQTENRSPAIQDGYDVVTSGLLAKCVDSWRKQWV